MEDGFTPAERAVVAAVAEALAPPLDGAPGAVALGVPAAVEEVVLTRFPGRDRAEFRRLLALLDRRLGGLVLAGRPARFTALDDAAREAYLLAMGARRLPAARQAFQALKRLTLFLHYGRLDAGGRNPHWDALGYAPPDAARVARERAPLRPPLRRVEVADGSALETDVVVVGSGAGGGVAAAHLARAGHRVLVLEAGEERDEDDFPGTEVEGHRDLYEGGGLFATRDLSVTLLAGATMGGGTTVNWMTSLAPPTWLREEWERLGVAGATGPEFDGYLREVESRLHVDLDESDHNGPNAVLWEGAVAAGLKEGQDFRRIPRNALGCRGRCQSCVFGCPFGAKQGVLVTYLRDAEAAGARFLPRARASRVLVEGGRAVGVDADVALAEGRTAAVRVKARAVVVACGAVHTAALLLRSGVRSRGLGRLFVHPVSGVPCVMPRDVRMWEGAMQTVVVDKWNDLDGERHGVVLENAPGHPGLSAASLPWRGGRAHAETMRSLRRTAALIVIARDRDPGRVGVSARGSPVVDYRVSPRDAKHLARGMQELARLERAAGAVTIATLHQRGHRVDADPATGRIREGDFEDFVAGIARLGVRPNDLGLFSAHQMGTCGIGRDGEAPTDARGRLRDVEGLYVADGSAFPSPSGVNPMLSIMTLARRTSAFAAEDLRRAA